MRADRTVRFVLHPAPSPNIPSHSRVSRLLPSLPSAVPLCDYAWFADPGSCRGAFRPFQCLAISKSAPSNISAPMDAFPLLSLWLDTGFSSATSTCGWNPGAAWGCGLPGNQGVVLRRTSSKVPWAMGGIDFLMLFVGFVAGSSFKDSRKGRVYRASLLARWSDNIT